MVYIHDEKEIIIDVLTHLLETNKNSIKSTENILKMWQEKGNTEGFKAVSNTLAKELVENYALRKAIERIKRS